MTVTQRNGARRISWGKVILVAYSVAVLLYLVGPLLVVLPLSFSSARYLTFPPPGWSLQWYERYLGSPQWTAATVRSLQLGVVVMLLAVVIGTAVAYGLAHLQFPGKRLVRAVVLSPLVVPVIILAVAVYELFLRLRLIGNFWALAIAHTVLALPFVVVLVSAALQTMDVALERAAASLGASEWQTFRYVTLPLIAPSMAAGAVFAFVTSWDELLVALFTSGTARATLPKRLWENVREFIDPTIAAVAVVIVGVSLLLLATLELLQLRAARNGGHNV